MRTTNRLILVGVVASLFVAMLAMPAIAGPAGQFISKINASRAAAGLAPLESYWDLADDARAHSDYMAANQNLAHSTTLGSVTSGWENLGENVGVNVDVAGMHAAFMNSAGHRANILGDFNYVGVGVSTDENGFIWATIIFMKAAPGLNGGTATTTTTVPPTTTMPPAAPPPAVVVANQPASQPVASHPVGATEPGTTDPIPRRLGDPMPPSYAI